MTPFSWHHHDDLMGDEDDLEAEEDVRGWIAQSNYVLQHCSAYFMSVDGDVESS